MDHKLYHRFEDFDLSRKLQDAVRDARLERPTELQINVIPPALADQDVIFEATSGMGKSACFAIPFLQHWLRDRNRKGMIITPSASSVQQLGKVIGRLCPSLKAKVLKFTERDDYFYPEFHGKCPLVILEYSVAKRFMRREKAFVKNVHSVGLDEIDVLLENEKELEELLQILSPDRQTLICANETNPHVIDRSRWYCDLNKTVRVKLSRPEVHWDKELVKLQYLVVDEETRSQCLLDLLKKNNDQVSMVITDADSVSCDIVEMLAEHDIEGHVLAYSMQLDEKEAIAKLVVEKGHGVLVSCEAAMNGLNLPTIDHLVSWELPSDLELYWRRIDRFVFKDPLTVTVLIDAPRSGAIRILDRRLGRPMTWLNEEVGLPARAPRGDRRSKRNNRRDSGNAENKKVSDLDSEAELNSDDDVNDG